MTSDHMDVFLKIADEIKRKFYGCGSPIPNYVDGLTVVDLGCGTGRDVYLSSGLVGE
jgi:arsenite methyltransferase